ncbi:glycoside hydrolase [Syncephalis plumigaleata]|nr:glycoside hydrolase [Syncephalis plumigaleata]
MLFSSQLSASLLAAVFVLGIGTTWSAGVVDAEHHRVCDVPLYCPGHFLDVVQSAHLEKDSKYFVDQPTSKPLAQVLSAFNALPKNPTKEQVKAFVDANFLPPGTEIAPANLVDYKENPSFLAEIKDENLRRFAHAVHKKWKNLGRVFHKDAICSDCVSSALPARHPFVVPGGRFREFYYWDSYFTIEGLLISGLNQTVKGMIENAMDYVNEYGFVPNGARIYFLNRSQPPFLTQMVRLYVDATNDTAFLREALPVLKKEHDFWMHNRTVTVSAPGKPQARLAVYSVTNYEPRPESWREDKEMAQKLPESRRRQYFANMASGAESGWDYSSRWLADGKTLPTINTNQIVPVELNSLLYMNEQTIAEFGERTGCKRTKARYEAAAKTRLEAIENYLWSEKDAQWYDFNLTSQQQNAHFYPSNIVPLWANAIDRQKFTKEDAARLVANIKPSVDLPGGAPTSLVKSGEQWDFPNAWPPLEHFVVYGLNKTGVPEGSALAASIAQRWISSNYCGWLVTGGDGKNVKNNGTLFEKYDATHLGIPGLGGEYEVQEGFGWTNGVVLSFLSRFGDRLEAPKDCPPMPASLRLPA